MKVKPSVKPICEKCKVIKRKGRVMIICANPKHSSVRAKGPRSIPRKPYPPRLGAKCVDSRRRPRPGHGMLLMEVLYGTYCWC